MKKLRANRWGAFATGVLVAHLTLSVAAVADVRDFLQSPESAAESAEGRAALGRMAEMMDDLAGAEPARYCGTPFAQFYLDHRDELTPAGQQAAMAQIRGPLPRTCSEPKL